MKTFKSKGLKIDVYAKILSGAYFGDFVEIYTKECTITLDVKDKEDAMRIYKKYGLCWEYE